MSPNLNLLPILDAVLQEQSVTRAAARMGCSQPAVSHALQHLRDLFRDELLVRVGPRYELTPAAQAIAAPLHSVLQQLADVLVARPTFDPRHAEREFTIATTDYLAASIVHPALRKFAVTAPGIRLNLVEATESDLVSDVRSGPGRIAIYPTERRPKALDLHFEALTSDTWCCTAWSGNPLIGESLTRETFESLPQVVEFFTPSPEEGVPGRCMASKGYRRQCIVRTNYILLIPFLLQGTSALAVLPRRLAEWLCQAADLRILPLPFELPDFRIEMCWSARHTTDPAHSWLRSVLKDAAAGL